MIDLNDIGKIDVCVVTKNDKIPKGLEFIPYNKIIVEKSIPIGLARRKAIEQVSTEYFAFIDDDIEITHNWFKILTSFIDDDVGAIWGWVHNEGLGHIFDNCLFDNQRYKELKTGERWNTSNSIIKTELVKDWYPSDNLKCFEDDEIGEHIMDKGYKVLFIPCDSIHHKDWEGIKESALWAGLEYYNYYKPNITKYLYHYVKLILMPFKAIFNRGIFYMIYVTYRNFFYIIGMIKAEKIKRKRK